MACPRLRQKNAVAFQDLRAFLSFLEERGQLHRITVPISPELEMTEIADRCVKGGGPALLFERVEGSQWPVVMNLFGSPQRMAWALGVSRLDELSGRVRQLLALLQNPPTQLGEKLRALGTLAQMAGSQPRLVHKAPCQEVVLQGEAATLSRIPALKCWPQDGGPYITMPLVITRHPRTGQRNVGIYRMQLFDGRTTAMHWQLHKDGAQHLREGISSGPLPVAVALGADPATVYAASAPLPPMLDEILFAGFLRGKGVLMVKGITVDLEVPAYSEIVLEGYVDPAERLLEGPFGDHTGYYSPADLYPVFHLTCITHRKNPIYLTTIVGHPPTEDTYLGKATERLFLPLVQTVLPEVVDINMPAEGAFHNLLLVSIKKEYPGHPRKVMHALWGMGLLMLTKTVVAVDHTVDVQNLAEVAWRVTNNLDPKRDLVFAEGPLDALDHASPYPHFGSKLGIDATAKGPQDGHPRPWPEDIVMAPEIKALVERRWAEYGL